MRSLYRIVFLTSVVFALSPNEYAYALQTHGSHEGLYAHQFAHLFFIFCMGSFVYRIHRSWLLKHGERKYFVLGGILLMAWNLWAFIGHLVTLLVPAESFVFRAGIQAPVLHITSWKEIFYYVLNMDHLLCVPALIFFYLGLRRILPISSKLSVKDGCE